MSAIARYYKFKGYEVSGYDRTPSELTRELEKAIRQAIAEKPEAHCFGARHGSQQTMNTIGG